MLKIFCILCLCLASLSVSAKKIARVHEVKGMSFAQKANGKMTEIYKDFVIESGDLVFTSEDSQLKIVDFYDREFLVSAESEVLWREEMAELRKGHVWAVSNREESFVITTANSHTVFSQFDGILSFDTNKARTDLSVSDGQAYFKNIELADIKVDLNQGQFSFIDKKYNNGVPRAPTVIGGDSYVKLTKFFNSKPELKIELKETSRSIASIFGEESVSQPVSKGKIILIKDSKPSRSIASVPSKKKRVHRKVSSAPVRFFGSFKKTTPVLKAKKIAVKKQYQQVKRAPSSIPKSALESSFEQSLNNHLNQQKRHPSERLDLIDELQSVSEDFQKEY